MKTLKSEVDLQRKQSTKKMSIYRKMSRASRKKSRASRKKSSKMVAGGKDSNELHDEANRKKTKVDVDRKQSSKLGKPEVEPKKSAKLGVN